MFKVRLSLSGLFSKYPLFRPGRTVRSRIWRGLRGRACAGTRLFCCTARRSFWLRFSMPSMRAMFPTCTSRGIDNCEGFMFSILPGPLCRRGAPSSAGKGAVVCRQSLFSGQEIWRSPSWWCSHESISARKRAMPSHSPSSPGRGEKSSSRVS